MAWQHIYTAQEIRTFVPWLVTCSHLWTIPPNLQRMNKEKIDVSGFTLLYSRSPQRGDSARRSEMLVGPFKLESWDQIQLSSESLLKVFCRNSPNVHGKWKEKFQKDLWYLFIKLYYSDLLKCFAFIGKKYIFQPNNPLPFVQKNITF